LEEFSFLANWPDLDRSQKLDLYSKHACHELSFFLYHKDPEFFRTVIAAYLKNKKDKTFMDHWLLGDDLRDYLEAWRFSRLNIVERILLGRRLRDQEPSVARDVRDRADLIPLDIEDFNRRFDTAVQIGVVETEGGVRQIIQNLRKQQDEKDKADRFGLSVAKPAMPAPAPAAPVASLAGAVAGGSDLDGGLGKSAAKAPAERLLRSRAGGRPAAGKDAELKEEPVQEFFAAEGRQREEARRFFQKLDHTKEWAENNYYHLRLSNNWRAWSPSTSSGRLRQARRPEAVPVEIVSASHPQLYGDAARLGCG